MVDGGGTINDRDPNFGDGLYMAEVDGAAALDEEELAE
jgi:hypothetical protein